MYPPLPLSANRACNLSTYGSTYAFVERKRFQSWALVATRFATGFPPCLFGVKPVVNMLDVIFKSFEERGQSGWYDMRKRLVKVKVEGKMYGRASDISADVPRGLPKYG